MGQYFKLYNDNHRTCIDPSTYKLGCKLHDWLYPDSVILKITQLLINLEVWNKSDVFYAVGDQEGIFGLNCPAPKYRSDKYNVLCYVYESCPVIIVPNHYEIVTKGRVTKVNWVSDAHEPAFDISVFPNASEILKEFYGITHEKWGYV